MSSDASEPVAPGRPGRRDPLNRRFEQALAHATRALAGRRGLKVVFGAYEARLAEATAFLPHATHSLGSTETQRLRGQADALALREAYHDPMVHSRNRPRGERARALFDAMEEARYQALGARVLVGVSANLAAALGDELRKRGALGPPGGRIAMLAGALSLLVRERLTGEPPPNVAARLLADWRPELESRVAPDLDQLWAVVDDQERYATVAREVIRHLDLGHELGPAAAPATKLEPVRPAATGAAEPPAAGAEALSVAAERGTLDTESELEPEAEPVPADDSLRADENGQPERERRGARLARARAEEDLDHPSRHYRIYTRAHDEVIAAERLCEPDELVRLRVQLDQGAKPLQSAVVRLANRLQRRLCAQQRRFWQFDQEEGQLDSARLARVVVDPLSALSYKVEADAEFKDTVVTLLLDNSGSMRGRPIMITALCADVLARTLERCGVKVEILGFTTRNWKGGLAKADWLSAGAPPQPGRLSELRHIIYKSADVPWRRARTHLGLMLREDLLKDNVDGEALLWAHERLLQRDEQRRILLVISDGVPLDEATLSANAGSYLEQHLRNVVEWIERRSPVELVAIGVGHDVTDIYSRAVAIADVTQLGGTITEQLAALFDRPPAAPQR
jgi:cobaltochelatase CobT